MQRDVEELRVVRGLRGGFQVQVDPGGVGLRCARIGGVLGQRSAGIGEQLADEGLRLPVHPEADPVQLSLDPAASRFKAASPLFRRPP